MNYLYAGFLSFTLAINFLNCSASAQENQTNIKRELVELIEADLVVNQKEIQLLSAQLSPSDKQFLYQYYQKQPLNTFLMNLLPIGGYASYQQGDLFGGISQSILDGGGLILIASSFLPDMRTNGGYSGALLLSYGIISLLTSRVIGGVTPWVHGNYYNAALESSLSYSKSEQLSVFGSPIYFQTGFAF